MTSVVDQPAKVLEKSRKVRADAIDWFVTKLPEIESILGTCFSNLREPKTFPVKLKKQMLCENNNADFSASIWDVGFLS